MTRECTGKCEGIDTWESEGYSGYYATECSCEEEGLFNDEDEYQEVEDDEVDLLSTVKYNEIMSKFIKQ